MLEKNISFYNLLVNRIHNDFPFEKVRSLFILLKLNFAFYSDDLPSVGDLKTITDRLIRDVCEEAVKNPKRNYFQQENYFRVDYSAGNKKVTLSFVLYNNTIQI